MDSGTDEWLQSTDEWPQTLPIKYAIPDLGDNQDYSSQATPGPHTALFHGIKSGEYFQLSIYFTRVIVRQ